MDKIKIIGKANLYGSIAIPGSKNAALPILVSSLLSKKNLYLSNLPNLEDIKSMIKLLKNFGVKFIKKNNILLLNANNIEKHWQDLSDFGYRYGDQGIFTMSMSGIDIALWDLLGKNNNLSLTQLLGGSVHDSLPCYASLPPLRSPEVVINETKRAIKKGIKTKYSPSIFKKTAFDTTLTIKVIIYKIINLVNSVIESLFFSNV